MGIFDAIGIIYRIRWIAVCNTFYPSIVIVYFIGQYQVWIWNDVMQRFIQFKWDNNYKMLLSNLLHYWEVSLVL
jgi:hypothetical protein